jgi:hypothetical protein
MEHPCKVQCHFNPYTKIWANGRVHLGITGGFGGDRRVEYIIPPDIRKDGTHSFVAEATCNGMFGVPWNGDSIQPPDVRLFTCPRQAEMFIQTVAQQVLQSRFS